MSISKDEKFSYSKISTMDTSDAGCPYKYKLIYVDKHFITDESIATSIGTLIHETEEVILNQIKNDLFGVNIDYNFLIKNIKEKFAEIVEKFPSQAVELGKDGRTYKDRIKEYIEHGIYRLEEYFIKNPNIKPLEAEKEFNLNYNGYIFHGFIDRIFYDEDTDTYIVEDIKTYAQPLEKKKLATPLQFVIYTLAIKQMFNVDESKIQCVYDLPFCQIKQTAGTKGFLIRGSEKLDKLLNSVENEDFVPAPKPLCHWCIFSKTYINGQPEEAKGLCPYYCHWTRQNKTMAVENEWYGWKNHEAVLKAFKESLENKIQVKIEPEVKINTTERRFLIRR